MAYLKVKNWDRHQAKVKPEHRDEFIALHTAVLDDLEFLSMPKEAQILLIQLWLLRGRIKQNIPQNLEYLHRMLGEFDEAHFDWVIEEGWLIATDEKKPKERKKSAPRKNYGAVEYSEDFKNWWDAYPRKKQKAGALEAWNQTAAIRPPIDSLIETTKAYARSVRDTEDKYIKLPGGWLRDRRWTDEFKPIRRPSKQAQINKILDREQVDHFAHPKWKWYVGAVTAGEIKPGFERYANENQ